MLASGSGLREAEKAEREAAGMRPSRHCQAREVAGQREKSSSPMNGSRKVAGIGLLEYFHYEEIVL